MYIRIIILLLFAFTATSASAQVADEPVWQAGVSEYHTSYARLSSNGRYVVFLREIQYMNSNGITVVDMNTGTCPLAEVLTINSSSYQDLRSFAVVSDDGDEIVIFKRGKVSWYHTGDTEPWWEEVGDTLQGYDRRFVGDSLVVVYHQVNDSTHEVRGYRPFSGGLFAVQRHDSSSGQLIVTGRDNEVLLLDKDSIYFSPTKDSAGLALPGSGFWYFSTSNELLFVWSDSAVAVVDLNARHIVYSCDGDFIGKVGQTKFITHHNEDIVLHDMDLFRADTLPYKHWYKPTIVRERILQVYSSTVDLLTMKKLDVHSGPHDILPDGTWLRADPANGYCETLKESKSKHLVKMASGTIKSVRQDKNDSTIYFASGKVNDAGGTSTISRFRNGRVTRTSHRLTIDAISNIVSINDEEAIVYAGDGFDHFTGGYVWLRDSITVAVELMRTRNYLSDAASLNFTERGDTLQFYQTKVNGRKPWFSVAGCKGETKDSVAPLTALVRGTPYLIAHGYRINYQTCSDSVLLPYDVQSVAPVGTVVFVATDTTYGLVDIERIGVTYNQQPRPASFRVASWADSGRTVRLYQGDSVVSLHLDGSTSAIKLPQIVRASRNLAWSNDGRVLTSMRRDTVVSIDIVTGRMLREYYKPKWMAKSNNFDLDYKVLVAPVDGSIFVSLYTGPFTVLPGVTPDYNTSVDNSSSTRELMFDINAINSTAVSGSTVYVYSMFGELLGTEPVPVASIDAYINSSRYPIVMRFQSTDGWYSRILR